MIENLKTMITHGGDIDTGRYGERLGGGGVRKLKYPDPTHRESCWSVAAIVHGR